MVGTTTCQGEEETFVEGIAYRGDRLLAGQLLAGIRDGRATHWDLGPSAAS